MPCALWPLPLYAQSSLLSPDECLSFAIRHSIFSFSAFRIPHSALNSLCPMRSAICPLPYALMRSALFHFLQPETIRSLIFTLCALLHALCSIIPQPATRNPHPATTPRNPQLTTHNPQPVTRATRCSPISPSTLPYPPVSVIQRS
jgi:hypothetical protein